MGIINWKWETLAKNEVLLLHNARFVFFRISFMTLMLWRSVPECFVLRCFYSVILCPLNDVSTWTRCFWIISAWDKSCAALTYDARSTPLLLCSNSRWRMRRTLTAHFSIVSPGYPVFGITSESPWNMSSERLTETLYVCIDTKAFVTRFLRRDYLCLSASFANSWHNFLASPAGYFCCREKKLK